MGGLRDEIGLKNHFFPDKMMERQAAAPDDVDGLDDSNRPNENQSFEADQIAVN